MDNNNVVSGAGPRAQYSFRGNQDNTRQDRSQSCFKVITCFAIQENE